MVRVHGLPQEKMVETVTITSRHWYRPLLFDWFYTVELHDGATAVDIFCDGDPRSLVEVIDKGMPVGVSCYCGPGAIYPQPLGQLLDGRRAARISGAYSFSLCSLKDAP
jgi:hypothetical protein